MTPVLKLTRARSQPGKWIQFPAANMCQRANDSDSVIIIGMSMKQMCPACKGRCTNGNGKTCQTCQGTGELDSKLNLSATLKFGPTAVKTPHST